MSGAISPARGLSWKQASESTLVVTFPCADAGALWARLSPLGRSPLARVRRLTKQARGAKMAQPGRNPIGRQNVRASRDAPLGRNCAIVAQVNVQGSRDSGK